MDTEEAPECLGRERARKSAKEGEQPIPSTSDCENRARIPYVDHEKKIEESGELSTCEVWQAFQFERDLTHRGPPPSHNTERFDGTQTKRGNMFAVKSIEGTNLGEWCLYVLRHGPGGCTARVFSASGLFLLVKG